MTTVNMKITGNKVVSSINGIGLGELKKVLEKMQDGLKWHLEVYSEATLQQVPFTDLSATSEDDTAAYHGQERAV